MLTVGSICVRDRHVGGGVRPDIRRDQPQDPGARRSIALGVATAGGSFGQFAIVPFASLMQPRFDSWHATMAVLGLVSVLMVPLALGLRESRRPVANAAGGGDAAGHAARRCAKRCTRRVSGC